MIHLAQQAVDTAALPGWAGLLFGPLGVLVGAGFVIRWLLARLEKAEAETKAAQLRHSQWFETLYTQATGAEAPEEEAEDE